MLIYRFARYLKIYEAEISETKLKYYDASQISPWAVDAVKYCQQSGIIAGRENGNFAPKDTETRAEVATTLERFIKSAVS